MQQAVCAAHGLAFGRMWLQWAAPIGPVAALFLLLGGIPSVATQPPSGVPQHQQTVLLEQPPAAPAAVASTVGFWTSSGRPAWKAVQDPPHSEVKPTGSSVAASAERATAAAKAAAAAAAAAAPATAASQPVPAPAPAPARAGPVAPALVQKVARTVDERIKEDSDRIGHIALSLMDIQGGIQDVEREALSKVFDMESMKSFLDVHDAAVDKNKELNREVTRLQSQVSSLAEQLDKAHRQMLQAESEHHDLVNHMTAEEVRDRDEVNALRKSIERDWLIGQGNAELKEANVVFRNQNVKAEWAVENVLQMLKTAKDDLDQGRKDSRSLENELLEQHKYAETCHHRALQNEMQVKHYEDERVELRTHATKTAQQNVHVQQQLSDKNQALKVRLEKAKVNLATTNSQIISTRARQQELTLQGERDLGHLRNKLGELREEEVMTEAELMKRIADRKVVENDIQQVESEIRRLRKELLSGELARLRTNNTQLKADLEQAQNTLQTSESNIVRYQAEVAQANETVVELKATANQSMIRAKEVAREAITRVLEAKKASDDAAAAAQEAVMRAEAAQLVDCNETWDKEHPKVLEEKDRCKGVKLDLDTGNAQVAALTSTISSLSES